MPKKAAAKGRKGKKGKKIAEGLPPELIEELRKQLEETGRENAELRQRLAESERKGKNYKKKLAECEKKLVQAGQVGAEPEPSCASVDSAKELEAALRSRLAGIVEELAAAPALLVGDRVARTTSSTNVPAGTVGVVVGPGKKSGKTRVKFPQETLVCTSSKLQRQDERRSAALVRRILARLMPEADTEDADAALRAQLAQMAEELAVSSALREGDRVTWTEANDDAPEGTVGVVVGPCNHTAGYLDVKFPKRLGALDPAQLRRQDKRRSSAQVQEILARLIKPPVRELTTLEPCSIPQALLPGDRVTWTDSNGDIPEGTVGVVQGPGDEEGLIEVEFSAGLADLSLAKLRREGSADFGHALGKLLPALGNAKMLIVSTPGFGPGPEPGEFKVPVMSGLERLANFLLEKVIPIYDFAGSASAKDCKEQIPDRDLRKYFEELLPEGAEPWSEPEIVAATQWMRYWMGCVRGAIKAMLLGGGASRQPGEVLVIRAEGNVGVTFHKGSLHLFPTSISGGPITQTEKDALAGLIRGVVADLSTRELDIGDIYIHWLHFESLEDYLKALQGYGGIDLGGAMQQRKKVSLPGEWVDGPRNAEYDLLTDVPGATPEERRAFLLTAAAPSQDQLNARLGKAIACRSTERVRELLGLDAANQPLPEGERPEMLPDITTVTNSTYFIDAAMILNLGALEALLAAGADPHALRDDGFCALGMAVQSGSLPREAAPGVAEEMDAVIDFCAQAQLGMTYAEHVARLTVGAAVTWTLTDKDHIDPGRSGTIFRVEETGRGRRAVEGSAGKKAWFSPHQLRLA